MSQRALIVKLGAIGDVIMVLPAVDLLRQMGLEIDWVCGNAARPLLECYSWINIISVDDGRLLKGNFLQKLVQLITLWQKIARHRYSVSANIYYDFRYRTLTLPVFSRKKIFLSKEDRGSLIIPGRGYVDEYARILMGSADSFSEGQLHYVAPDRLPEGRLSREQSKPRVALVPAGASNILHQQTLRRWPAERYADLARELVSDGFEVVITGGPDDFWVRPYFSEIPVTDLIGALSLPELVATYNQCDVVVSHDTGPLHVAGISKACVVGLFGPTSPNSFLPRRERVVGIWGGEGLACRPCYDGQSFANCQHNGCMWQIEVAAVRNAISALLKH